MLKSFGEKTRSRKYLLWKCIILSVWTSLTFLHVNAAEHLMQKNHNLKNLIERAEKSKPESLTVIKKAELSVSVLPSGKAFRITYNWNASPMKKDYNVWVHIKNKNGETVLTNDHIPPFPTKTSTWTGAFNYTRLIKIPADFKEGIYTIDAGIFDKKTGDRQKLIPDSGVGENQNFSYQIGTFTVDNNAPAPPLDSSKPVSLDLTGYKITFSDEFNGPLDVSPLGPGTKWIAHTPYFGDFGDSKFVDPEENFPFKVKDGILTIQARKNCKGEWESGLLCSVDTAGNGFAQQYGYFEMRAKFPKGPGTWPAFWLLALQKLQDKSKMGFEVDIVEQYGRNPDQLHSVLHWWFPDKSHGSIGNQFTVEDMTKDFHNYGFLWDEENMIWYFDGVELWRQPTPPESKTPMYVLFNLALGPGWPIDKTPDPSNMLVDYIRVYSKNDVLTEKSINYNENPVMLSNKTVPEGWGVQLKLHSNSSKNFKKIKGLGLKWVRHGFHWESIEKEKGIYDFNVYDRIVEDAHDKGLKMVGCIAFSNKKVYGTHAKDEPGRSAYARFAAALAARYKDYDIVWEIWNEPNTMTFWGKHGGKGNSESYAEEYINLVKSTVPAMKSANPDCIILGGSVSNMWTESYKWMNFIFQKGVLKTGIDVWSVHPYGVKSPEDYIAAYDSTRKMMINAGGPVLPLMNTERGFPLGKLEGYAGGDERLSHEYQAWHIVRQYLIDQYLDAKGTIWYEWIGKDKEVGFSLYREGKLLPIYIATKVLIEQLNGYSFEKRIDTNNPLDFVLQYKNSSGNLKLVAWTSPPPMESPDKTIPHSISIPVKKEGKFKIIDIYGKSKKQKSKDGQINIDLSGAPQYINII